MKQTLLVLFLLLYAVAAISQQNSDGGIQLRADYAAVQNKLYKIANKSRDVMARQAETFRVLHDFIQQYPAAENSLYLLAEGVNLSYAQIDSLMRLLDSSLNRSPYRGTAENTRKRIAVAETGKPFPDTRLSDTSGNSIPVSKYLGKTVLIDFWSSWCGPCRQQIPGLRKLYKKYNKAGFEIIGVSMDTDKKAWLKAIADDGQTWPQYCELVKFSVNKMARRFYIYGIPANFLIDRNGVIVGQDLSPDQVGRYLESQP